MDFLQFTSMPLALLITAAGAVLLLIRWKWQDVRDHWKQRGVAHLQPHPVLGSFTFMMKVNMSQWLKELSERFGSEPYVGIWLFWKPALVVSSAEVARNILIRDFHVFCNRYAAAPKNDRIGHYGIFLAKEPYWSSMRKKLSPFFSTSKLKAVDDIRLKKAKELVQRFKNNMEINKTEDIRVIFSDYSSDVVGAAAFGLVGEATLTGDSPIKRITREFMEYSFWRGLSWTSIFFMPGIAPFFRFRFFPIEATDFLTKVFNKVVVERGGWEARPKELRDLFDALLQVRREARAKGDDMSEDEVIAQAAIFLQGGFESTALVLSYAFMELAHNPDYQEKLYTEVKKAKDKLNGGDFNTDAIMELTLLKSIVKETLRKYPPIGFLDRHAQEDYRVDDKLTIKKGTPVYINVLGLHYNPKYYENPEQFKPERFFPENKDKLPKYAYFPFGEGPRGCIAYRFGLLSAYFAVAYMVLSYEVFPQPGSLHPSRLRLNPRTTLVVPDAQMLVDFRPRRQV